MSIHHVVRCDRNGCSSEAPVKSNWSDVQRALSGGQLAVPVDERPSSWLRAENRDFCSWDCLGQFAMSMSDFEAKNRKAS